MELTKPLIQLRKINTQTDYEELLRYLKKQKPKNVSKMSLKNFMILYPEEARRKTIKAIDIVLYWTDKFRLDWGEPECFGCKQFGWSGLSGVDFSKWNGLYTKAHIVSACYGGPFEAWNTVFLCDWCHKTFDNTMSGLPMGYKDSVKWLRARRQWVIDQMIVIIKEYPTVKAFYSQLKNWDEMQKNTKTPEVRALAAQHVLGMSYETRPIHYLYALHQHAFERMTR